MQHKLFGEIYCCETGVSFVVVVKGDDGEAKKVIVCLISKKIVVFIGIGAKENEMYSNPLSRH